MGKGKGRFVQPVWLTWSGSEIIGEKNWEAEPSEKKADTFSSGVFVYLLFSCHVSPVVNLNRVSPDE